MLKHAGLAGLVFLLGCGDGGSAPGAGEYGANPTLPEPRSGLPAVNAAPAVGWADGAAPVAPPGFVVTRYAEELAHPRWIYRLPNNDVLVAESATRPARDGGFMGWIANRVQRRAGAFERDTDRITLLRDRDLDGVVDERRVFAQGLNQPFGMALIGNTVYIANTNAVLSYRYTPGAVRVQGMSRVVLELPYRAGDNGHWTRSLVVNADASKLYVGVGSSSNIADHGMAAERGRAAIWELNPDGSRARIYASGLRNPVGMDFEPVTGALWVVVNERDMLGDRLVPDYMTSVREDGFYGWPYSYFGQHVDERVRPQRPDLVAQALRPDYALGAHTAPLGLMFYTDDAFPDAYHGGAFIGMHGSWNRSERVGYKVVFVRFENGGPVGAPEDFLTGFLDARGRAQGRPVGVATDGTGALLVADDVGDIVWRIAPAEIAE